MVHVWFCSSRISTTDSWLEYLLGQYSLAQPGLPQNQVFFSENDGVLHYFVWALHAPWYWLFVSISRVKCSGTYFSSRTASLFKLTGLFSPNATRFRRPPARPLHQNLYDEAHCNVVQKMWLCEPGFNITFISSVEKLSWVTCLSFGSHLMFYGE